MAGLRDAAWLYPDPMAGRENLKDHITFATNKGVVIIASPGKEAVAGKSGEVVSNEGTSRRAAAPATRPRVPTPSLPAKEDITSADHAGVTFGALATKYLSVGEGPAGLVRCHTNCSQSSQGTAFLAPQIRRGQTITLHVRCVNKPGRMRYFIGCAPAPFAVDSAQYLIQRSSYALENLKAGPHCPGRPCDVSAPPCFHTGSIVTMRVDLSSSPGSIAWAVDTTGVRHRVSIAADVRVLHAFVSLYNRDACFEVQEHSVREI